MLKRGMSPIIITLFIIVLSLGAVTVVWTTLRSTVSSVDDGGQTQTCLGLVFTLESCEYNATMARVRVSRGVGEGEITGLRFAFETNTGSALLDKNTPLPDTLEALTYIFGDISTPSKVDVAALVDGETCGLTGSPRVCTLVEGWNSAPVCGDGIDNDDDGWCDAEGGACTDGSRLGDPACGTNPDNPTEDLEGSTTCSNQKDDDFDGLIDGYDVADCDNPYMNGESPPVMTACSDGIDNDDDGFCDLVDSICMDGSTPGDSGCTDANDNDENTYGNLACNDDVDNDGDGLVDFGGDYGCDSSTDVDEKGDWTFRKPKRLSLFQLVGGSSSNVSQGTISNAVWNHQQGWNSVITNWIDPVRTVVGNDAFDVVFFQIGGGWSQYRVWLPGDGIGDYSYSSFLFEALTIAESNISPSTTDYTPLTSYSQAHGIQLLGYLGMPRCEEKATDKLYVPVPEQCYPENFDYYQGELMDGSFIAVGYDWSGGHMAENSTAISVNFAIMRDLGVEPYLEAVPPRRQNWSLGYSVISDEIRWQFTESDPQDRFFKESELNAAGGTTMHLVRSPPEGTCATGDDACFNAWRWNTSVSLLQQNKHVIVNLKYLLDAGYNVSCLVKLSQDTATVC
ncbi:MAG: hypothetical protein AABX53_00345 [Nanoarchaeota archaeon]